MTDFPDDRPIINFDGHCALCSRFAQFVIRHDRHRIFRLMAAQSPPGQALYRHLDLDPARLETNVLLENGRGWFKSDGSIRIFARLGVPWSLSKVLKLAPPPLLDRLYGWGARNRLRWCGGDRFPKEGVNQRISVRLMVEGDGERWVRCIGGRTFSSRQRAGRRHPDWLVRERLGPVSVDMALVVEGTNLRHVVRRWRLPGVPLPLWLGPRSTASETVQDGKFSFDVEIGHPLIGRVVRYRGLLTEALM